MELILQILLGWLVADLITGLFHWWEDTQGREEWPIIGPWIITPNRLHHAVPLLFTEHGFWMRNRASFIASGLIGAAWVLAFGLSAFIVTVVVGLSFSNEIHRYAHQPRLAPAFVRGAQKVGLFQSAKHHAAHHRPPFTANFCTLTSWLNPVIEGARHARWR